MHKDVRFANIPISKPYTVPSACDSGDSDKRMTRLVSALRGEARLMQGILKINLIADFRTSLLVGRWWLKMYLFVSCI